MSEITQAAIAQLPVIEIPLCTSLPGNPVLLVRPDGTLTILLKRKSAEQ